MNYKKRSEYLGDSDVASLTLRLAHNVYLLRFGEDNSYKAWIIDENSSVPEHYWLECEKVYRAGDRGCLIQLFNERLMGND